MIHHCKLILLAFFFLMSGIQDAGSMAGDESEHVKWVEDFSKFKPGAFPEGWKSRSGDGSKVYTIRSDQGSYLEARAVSSAVTIAKKFEYDLREYPFLAWQWRTMEAPKGGEGGDERHKKTGDSTAAVYVIFGGRVRPDNIKYVWSASLPVGTTTASPYSSDTKIVVLRNQTSSRATWFSEKVNVYEDYKRLFGHDPGRVQAIGIMSDSDNTQSTAVAHYRGIQVSKE
jgi:hypothetical protein